VELYSLTPLQTLLANDNQLEGEIRPEINQLSNLKTLRLGGTLMSGSLPDELYQLGLVELNLDGANFSGPLSETLANLSSTLRELSLRNNNFSGPLPAALDQLEVLRKFSCDLRGPRNLSCFRALCSLFSINVSEELHIEGNQMTGRISQEICRSRGDFGGELQQLTVGCAIECTCCDKWWSQRECPAR